MKEKVIEIIKKTLGLDKNFEINENTLVREDLHADSIDSMELVVNLEEAFDCRVDDDKLQEIKTVGDILRLLETCKK